MERLTYWNRDAACWFNHGTIGEIIDRLAAYENAMPLERAQEFAQAEKDGRLVVLPDAKYTDADGEKALQKAMWICGNTNNPVTRYTADAIAEKLCREVKDENLSLTLEELREMDGMPVWIVEGSCAHYVLITDIMEDGLWVICREDESKMLFTDYSKTWIAYRRKPEERTK